MTIYQLDALIGSVKAANLEGRLFLVPRSKRLQKALALLTRKQLVLAVPATNGSLAGYCAIAKPGDLLEAQKRVLQ